MTDLSIIVPLDVKTAWLPDWGNVTYCDKETNNVFHQIVSYSAILTMPIDFTGIYFILYKSPKEMANYKFFLLGHQICITLLDAYLSLLVIPEFIFPIWGTKIHGFFNYLEVPIWISAGLALGQLGTVTGSIMALFYYRMQIILPSGNLIKHENKGKTIFYVTNFFIHTVACGHYTVFIPVDQLSAKREWFQKRICVQQIFFDYNTYVLLFAPEKYYFYFLFYYMLLLIAMLASFIFIFTYYMGYRIILVSEATRKAQKMFFIALCVQVLVPLLMGIIPVMVYLQVRHWYFERQILNHWMLLIEALHGSSETVLMLFAIAPYRRALLRRKNGMEEKERDERILEIISAPVSQQSVNSGSSGRS